MNKPYVSKKTGESLGVAATVARLPLAVKIAKKIAQQESITTPLGMFIGADIADGVVARFFDADTALRRFLDAVIDRCSVGLASKEMWRTNPTARPFLAILAARELTVSALNAVHYMKTGEVVHGTGIHKLSSLSIAAFAVGAATNNKLATISTGAVACTINCGLTTSYAVNLLHPFGEVEDGVRHIGLPTREEIVSCFVSEKTA